jgi:F-type H+-transporting ATPase subunit a
MENIGIILKWQFTIFGKIIEYSPVMLLMTWIVIFLILLLAFVSTRKMQKQPSRLQMLMELFYKSLRDLTYSTLGEDKGKPYVNYIATLFIFILISNILGILPPFFHFFYLIFYYLDMFLPIPSSLYSWMIHVPVFQEPTKFLSTTLGLGILSAIVVHTSAIRTKGLLGYIKSYMDPLPSDGFWLLIFWINPFFYLNVIGEFAKVVSHSFRLFGNILGSSIIIIIISELIFRMIPIVNFSEVTVFTGTLQSILMIVASLVYILGAAFLSGFFGLFTGTLQAFVFTMLAVTYIAVTVSE